MVGPGQGLVGTRGQLDCVLSSVQWGARTGASGPLPLWGDVDWRGKGKDVGTWGYFCGQDGWGVQTAGEAVGRPAGGSRPCWGADVGRWKACEKHGDSSVHLHVLRTDLGNALRKVRRGLSGGSRVSGGFYLRLV